MLITLSSTKAETQVVVFHAEHLPCRGSGAFAPGCRAWGGCCLELQAAAMRSILNTVLSARLKLLKPLFSAALFAVFARAEAGAVTNRWETLPAPLPLPTSTTRDRVSHDGADIWFSVSGDGTPVIMLHGGLTNSDSWGNEVPALTRSHHRVILIDSRGHGRSSLGDQPLSYELMESDGG